MHTKTKWSHCRIAPDDLPLECLRAEESGEIKCRELLLPIIAFLGLQLGAMVVAYPFAIIVGALMMPLPMPLLFLPIFVAISWIISFLPLTYAPGVLVGYIHGFLTGLLLLPHVINTTLFVLSFGLSQSTIRSTNIYWLLWLAATPAFAHLAWRLSRASGKRRLQA